MILGIADEARIIGMQEPPEFGKSSEVLTRAAFKSIEDLSWFL